MHAVITGDVVKSTRLTADRFKNVRATLLKASKEVKRRFPDQSPYPLELFRGDSWQLLVSDPADALRIGLFVRAYLRSEVRSAPSEIRPVRVDTRFAIGVGAIDVTPERTVGEGRGEAFRLSGEQLDARSGTRMRFAISPECTKDRQNSWREQSVVTVLHVLDIIVSRWTVAQAYAVRGALLDLKQEQIAEKWFDGPITQQAAGQHLSAAGWDGVREAVKYYEQTMEAWLA